MDRIKLYLFGTPRLKVNGTPIEVPLRKGLALLVYCAVTRQAHSRDTLAALLWPEKDQQAARANLRRSLYELNHLLGGKYLEADADKVVLQTSVTVWLDIEQFQHALADLPLSDSPPDSSPHPLSIARLTRLKEAADLYAADFMAGFTLPDCPEFDDWQFFLRETQRNAYATLLHALTNIYEDQAQWEEAIQYARRWLTLDPLDEAIHRRLMQLYACAGQAGAAVRQYEECVRILSKELATSPAEETSSLYEAIRTRRFPASDDATTRTESKGTRSGEKIAPSHAAAAVTSTANTLPTYTTPFIGRHQELAALLRTLHDPTCRLLTLVGPGGIGKTRVAVEAARAVRKLEPDRVAPPFKDGSFFVPLQPVTLPGGIASAIAGALDLQFYSGIPAQQQLLHFLREKELLLVLDNFEHLLAGATFVAELLTTAPRVKVLVTSREALKLQEEWFHPLPGMRLSHGDVMARQAGAELIAEPDAVQLFVQTAHRAQAAFDPTRHRHAIARICSLVDGMPLAIELAASWLKVLTCEQIAHEIESGIDILVTRHQNVPARHQSMRVMLASSWSLLGEEAQAALKRLSVFRGGFLPDAAAMAGADLLTLAELVDTSWVYRDAHGRYQMHELLRQSAATHLAEVASEEAAMQDHHAAFYLQYIAQFEQALLGPQQREALECIEAEIDNVQTAWMRAVAACALDLLDRALQPLYQFFYMRSRYAEGEELFAAALHQLDTRSEGDAATSPQDEAKRGQISLRLLARLGNFHLSQIELAAADRCFTEVRNRSQDQRELAFIYRGLGASAKLLGDRAATEAALHQSLVCARASQDKTQIAESLSELAPFASLWSDFAEGQRFANEALVLCRQLQRPDLTAQVLVRLAMATTCMGGYAEAERYFRECLVVSETLASPFGVAQATCLIGWVAFSVGGARLSEALLLYEQAMDIWRRIGHFSGLSMNLGDYALAASELGDYAVAHRYAQEGLALAEKLDLHDFVAYNLYCVGAALCGLNDLETSRHYLLRSLQLSSKLHFPGHMAAALYYMVQVLIKESKLAGLSPAARADKIVSALELLALITGLRTTYQPFRDRARLVQAALMQELPVEVATAAIVRGKARTLTATVAEIVAEIVERAHLPESLQESASYLPVER